MHFWGSRSIRQSPFTIYISLIKYVFRSSRYLGSRRLSQLTVLTNILINNASSYSVLPLAPSVLPLKRPCSLSRTEPATINPKFGVYIIYIYPTGRVEILTNKSLFLRFKVINPVAVSGFLSPNPLYPTSSQSTQDRSRC